MAPSRITTNIPITIFLIIIQISCRSKIHLFNPIVSINYGEFMENVWESCGKSNPPYFSIKSPRRFDIKMSRKVFSNYFGPGLEIRDFSLIFSSPNPLIPAKTFLEDYTGQGKAKQTRLVTDGLSGSDKSRKRGQREVL
jgi:hypothetical protein